MSFKNILVAYSGSEASQAALTLASKLAIDLGAHVTGVLTHGMPAAFYSYASQMPQTVLAEAETADNDHRAIVQAKFFGQKTGVPADRIHYLDMRGEADLQLIETARTYDLVVMGPADPDADFPHMETHADVIARDSGRPVLLAPTVPHETALNGHVLIAWDGRNAAARALSDAMSLITAAKKVTILSVGVHEEDKQALNRLLTHLQRHGVSAELITRPKRMTRIGDIILETAAEIGAGLVVMGAYEHSKFAEDLFGGATNRVMARASIPILMAH